jgi:hypothetical protein
VTDTEERKLLISEIISTRIWATLKVVAYFVLGKMLDGKKWDHQVLPPFFVIVYFHNRPLMVTVLYTLLGWTVTYLTQCRSFFQSSSLCNAQEAHFMQLVPASVHCTDLYRGADKSLARPTSRCIFFMVRIFRLMLVLLYI